MEPGDLPVVGLPHAEYLGLLPLAQEALAGRLGNPVEDLLFREPDQTIRVLAVDADGLQKLEARLEKIVRRLVVAGNRVFPVILDAVLPDQFGELGDEDLHVELLFAHDRPGDRLFADIQKI